MFCTNCGQKITDELPVCLHCGNEMNPSKKPEVVTVAPVSVVKKKKAVALSKTWSFWCLYVSVVLYAIAFGLTYGINAIDFGLFFLIISIAFAILSFTGSYYDYRIGKRENLDFFFVCMLILSFLCIVFMFEMLYAIST